MVLNPNARSTCSTVVSAVLLCEAPAPAALCMSSVKLLHNLDNNVKLRQLLPPLHRSFFLLPLDLPDPVLVFLLTFLPSLPASPLMLFFSCGTVSLCYLSIYAFIHLSTHPLIPFCIYPFMCSFIQSLIHSCTHTIVHLHIHQFRLSYAGLLTHQPSLLLHLLSSAASCFCFSFICSYIHPFIHAFIIFLFRVYLLTYLFVH